MLPEAIDLHIEPSNIAQKLDLPYFTDCKYSWDTRTLQIYQIMIVSFLFVIPFILMSVAYYQIAKVLWIRHIPGSAEKSSPTANSRRSSSQINRSFRSLNSNKNPFYTSLCYLCCCKCFFGCCCGRSKKRTDRQKNNNRSALNRQINLNNNDNQNNKMSFELNGSLKTGAANTASPNDESLQCTPLDTPSGTQSPTHPQSNLSPESTINIDNEPRNSIAINDTNNMETIIETSYPSTLAAKHFDDQTNLPDPEEQPLNPTTQVGFSKNINEINLSSLSNNLRNNLSNNGSSNNMPNNFTTSDSPNVKSSLMRTTINKLNRCKCLFLRLLRLESSSKIKNQVNGISLTDNYERQDTTKTELTTLSNGQIEFGNSFQTTSFIRSKSTRAKTIEEKHSRSSTPVQTLVSHQGSFKRLRRMTLPGNRLSKYISGMLFAIFPF